jgi:hypothetical protein
VDSYLESSEGLEYFGLKAFISGEEYKEDIFKEKIKRILELKLS